MENHLSAQLERILEMQIDEMINKLEFIMAELHTMVPEKVPDLMGSPARRKYFILLEIIYMLDRCIRMLKQGWE